MVWENVFGPFVTPFHPEKGVADMFRIGRTTQSHVPSLDPAVSRKTFGCDRALFCGMQCPTLSPFLEIRILDVGEKERVLVVSISVLPSMA